MADGDKDFTEGLEDVIAGKSAITDVDGSEGKLIYAGYDIHDLAQNTTFEEVVYLLWHGQLPTESQLAELNEQLDGERALPHSVVSILEQLPEAAAPMDTLRSATSLLALYDPDAGDESLEANRRKALRLTAQTGTLVAVIDRLRKGGDPVAPKPGLSTAANFLYQLTGKEPDATSAHALDVALILHADHELNASTFAARVIAATRPICTAL